VAVYFLKDFLVSLHEFILCGFGVFVNAGGLSFAEDVVSFWYPLEEVGGEVEPEADE